MAKLLCISVNTESDDVQYDGDVVGVFPDSHIFSAEELAKFTVLTVMGERDAVQARLNQLRQRTATAYLWADGLYYFYPPPPPEREVAEVQVYQDGIRWYRIESDFKFGINVAGLTAEEKQVLETVDIWHPSVDAFIGRTIKDFRSQPGNNSELRDLRNLTP